MSDALRGLTQRLEADADTRPQTVLICGSLYLAGDVLRMNGEIPD